MSSKQLTTVARELERVGCRARRADNPKRRAKAKAEIHAIATAILAGDYGKLD